MLINVEGMVVFDHRYIGKMTTHPRHH